MAGPPQPPAAVAILGYAGCAYHGQAIEEAMAKGVPHVVTTVADLQAFRALLKRSDVAGAVGRHEHSSSPLVFELAPKAAVVATTMGARPGLRRVSDRISYSLASATYIGGCEELQRRLGVPTVTEAMANQRRADTSSRPPAAVMALFQRLQCEHDFVVWVFWRGAW